jgi:cephalosporin hydroxylase
MNGNQKLLNIDFEAGVVTSKNDDQTQVFSLGTPEAFSLISEAWLRCGWDNKYVYGFTWLGRPVIQLPEDMFRIHELIYRLKPDVLVETGVAHGGSLVFYATLFHAMGKGRVIGVDIEIRPHNRKAIETHKLSKYITLIEGSSIDAGTVEQVRSQVQAGDRVLVVLDSNHTKAHVLGELRAYSPMVTPESYIVACDGIMSKLIGAPRSQEDWEWNNPREAVREFLMNGGDFVLEEPAFPFNEGSISERVTYWPDAFLRRAR